VHQSFIPSPQGLLVKVEKTHLVAEFLGIALASVAHRLRQCPRCQQYFFKDHKMLYCSELCGDKTRRRRYRDRLQAERGAGTARKKGKPRPLLRAAPG
jgi:hypothetical protein